MSFIKDYPNLFQFFGGYFPDADFENLPDEEIVSKYVLEQSNNFQKINQLVADIESLVNNIENYWEEVGDEANRYFENSQEGFAMVKYDPRRIEKIKYFILKE